eukprot:7206818-Prymnesium_polylepis.2
MIEPIRSRTTGRMGCVCSVELLLVDGGAWRGARAASRASVTSNIQHDASTRFRMQCVLLSSKVGGGRILMV